MYKIFARHWKFVDQMQGEVADLTAEANKWLKDNPQIKAVRETMSLEGGDMVMTVYYEVTSDAKSNHVPPMPLGPKAHRIKEGRLKKGKCGFTGCIVDHIFETKYGHRETLTETAERMAKRLK